MSSGNHFLDSFFYPESIAVVGASQNQNTVNFYLFHNLVKLNFPGQIYPVNPNAKEIMGYKAYPNVGSIEGDIDLAVISVPANRTPGIIRDCVAKKVKMISIIAGGFSETGSKGRGVQDEILSLLKGSGIRTIGPNALSPLNAAINLLIGFGPVEKLPRGKLSFIFQSGLYQPRLNWLISQFNLYLNKLIDLGNKMDVNEVDALEYLAQDDSTDVIALHMESIAGDARKFMQLLRDTTKRKPVIVLKSGRTAAGARAASSHTGAIIKSSDTVVDVALRQAGALRVQGLDEFFDTAKVFEYLPPLRGNRIAVSTFPGGEGVIAADCCQLNGLTLAEYSPETHSKLRSTFPTWEIPVNPFDMGVSNQFHGAEKAYSVLLEALANDSSVDCLALQVGASPTTYSVPFAQKLGKLLVEIIGKGKPVTTWVTDPVRGGEMVQQLGAVHVPVYPSAERAIKALSALYRFHKLNDGA